MATQAMGVSHGLHGAEMRASLGLMHAQNVLSQLKIDLKASKWKGPIPTNTLQGLQIQANLIDLGALTTVEALESTLFLV
jgi:hypothetical protein